MFVKDTTFECWQPGLVEPDEAAAVIRTAAAEFMTDALDAPGMWSAFHTNLSVLCRDEPLTGDFLACFDALETWEAAQGPQRDDALKALRQVAPRLAMAPNQSALQWGRSTGIRSDAPPEFGPGEAVGVLSSFETSDRHEGVVVVEYLVGGNRAEVPREHLESLSTPVWLRRLGFDLVVNEDEAGGYAADFVRLGSSRTVTRAYGRGDTPDSAIESARRRYFVEQIGSEAERRPKRPLP